MSVIRNLQTPLVDRAGGASAIEDELKDPSKTNGGSEDAAFVKAHVDVGTVAGARSRALNSGSAMRNALFDALPDSANPIPEGNNFAAAVFGLVVGEMMGGILTAGPDAKADSANDVPGTEVRLEDLDPAAQQEILDGLKELGFEGIDDLSSPEAADAIAAIKEYAGFPGTSEIDFDFLIAMFMARAQDEQARSGSKSRGGGGKSGAANYAQQRAAGGNAQPMSVRRADPIDTSNWSPGAGDVTPQQLQDIASSSGHSLSAQRAAEVAPHLNVAMAEAGIDTPKKKAAFIAQLMHESGAFRYNEEIASGADYEGRRDLGNTQPGDGRRFKGRGFIQLTGRANYEAAGRALGLDLVNNPELAAQPENAARVAAWYWNSRGLSSKAEAGDFAGITRSINGGTNGAADRNRLYGNALNILADSHGLPSTGTFTEETVRAGGSPSGLTGDITPINQADGGNTRLGRGRSTLRGAGCMLSAYGMAAQAISGRTDGMGVRDLNQLVLNNNGFSGSGLVGPTAARAMGMTQTGRETISSRNASSRINDIAASLEAGNPVVLGVDYKAGSRGSGRGTGVDHWITITGRDPDNPNRFIALDPAGGREISLEVGPDGMLSGQVGSKNYVAREMITFEQR